MWYHRWNGNINSCFSQNILNFSLQLRNPISNLSKKKTKEKPSFLSHPAPGYIEDEYEEENDEYEEEYNEEDYDEEYLPSLVKCRQCSVPSEDGFLCSRGGPHFTCSVCFLPFPDRSSEGIGNFQCKFDFIIALSYFFLLWKKGEFCGSVVCGGYWRCPNSGKLQLLGEYSLTSLPSHALNYNPVEVSILQEYLTSK